MANTKNNWQVGIVHWFDDKSGEGMIKSSDGNLYFVHESAIEAFTKFKTQKRKALQEKAAVEFQLVEDVTFQQVSRIRERK